MGQQKAVMIAVGLLMCGLLVACDDEEPEARESAESRIIEAGYAAEVEVSGAGQVLVAYVQPPEDDEGTYLSAWRLYDDSDQPVVDGRGSRVEGGSATPTLWSLREGFLMRRPSSNGLERIDVDGDVSPVRFGDRPRPTRAGDVLVSDEISGRARFYRPSDDTLYRLPELPGRISSIAIDRLGGVWVALRAGDGVTAYSRDGRSPWRTIDYDLPAGSYPAQLQVSGDAVLLPLLDTRSSSSSVLSGLLTQDIESPGPWARVELDGVDSRRWIEPEVAVVAPGRLLMGDWGPRWYIGGGGAWHRIALPDPEPHEDFVLEPRGDRIFVRSTQHRGLRWSDDLGRTWHDFAR